MLDVVERLRMMGGGDMPPSQLELEAAAEIIALRSKLKAADEAWHEQEDELQALRGKLNTAQSDLAESEGHCKALFDNLEQATAKLSKVMATPSVSLSTYEALESRLGEITRKYNELICLVGNKFPEESRHETAKRYLAAFEALGSSTLAANGKPV